MSNRRNFIKVMGIGTVSVGLALASNKVAFSDNNKNTTKPKTLNNSDKALKIISLNRLEKQAKEILPPASYAFIAGGTGEQWTLKENQLAFNNFSILTHRLKGISKESIDTKINLLGVDLEYPIISAPAGVHAFANSIEAELGSVKGVNQARTLFTSSGASGKPLEQIAQAAHGPKWFQIYFNNDLAVNMNILQRAKKAGYKAIVLTVDAIGPGTNNEFISLGSPFPKDVTFANNDPKYGGIGDFKNQKIDLTPDDIKFIIDETGLPVIVKGILRGKDADIAIKAGASAIQVSNHGGRQMDGVPASINVLEEVATVVNKRVPIIFDSGIRSGIDIFRALSLGADAVAIGRPMLFGLAVGGSRGVQSVFEYLQDDFKTTMLFAGTSSLKEINSSYLKRS